MHPSESAPHGWPRTPPTAATHHAAADGVLPAHSADCLGCGPDNPHGHQLQVHRDGARVHSRHVFDQRHVGAPGLVHGGAVATVLDDLCGHVLTLIGVLAVTRHLAVNYHAPTRIDTSYELSAWLVRRDGRKLFLRAEGHTPHGQLTFVGDGVFLHVDPEHFARATSPDQPRQ